MGVIQNTLNNALSISGLVGAELQKAKTEQLDRAARLTEEYANLGDEAEFSNKEWNRLNKRYQRVTTGGYSRYYERQRAADKLVTELDNYDRMSAAWQARYKLVQNTNKSGLFGLGKNLVDPSLIKLGLEDTLKEANAKGQTSRNSLKKGAYNYQSVLKDKDFMHALQDVYERSKEKTGGTK